MHNKNIYTDSRVLKTKNLCKQALLSLLEHQPLNEITVINIVETAKITRGTFYNHYKDKEDLFIEMIDEVVLSMVNSYREPYLNKKSFKISDIASSSLKLFDSVYQNAEFYTTVINSNMLFIFQSKLCNGIEILVLNDLRNHNPKINPAILAQYQAYAITGLIIEWVKDDFKYSPKYMSAQLMEIAKIPASQTLYKI